MQTLGYFVGAYVVVGVFIGIMIHFKKGEDWLTAVKDGLTWPKLLPQMWQ